MHPLTLCLWIFAGVFAATWLLSLVTWENFSKNTYDFFKLSGFPIFYVYMIIPFGSLLWLIQLLRKQSRPGATSKTDDSGGTI